ncbi:MAG: hypothetical protein U0835_14600 [Isosphaeraceae bacterium]
MTEFRRRPHAAWLVLLLVWPTARADAGPITITSPGAGETWCVGSRHVIAWKVEPAATARVEFSDDDGKTWTEVSSRTPAAGTLEWLVPDRVSESCRVRVSPEGVAEGGVSGRFRVAPSREVKEYRWVQVNGKAPFAPRDGAGALTFRGKMWLIGGWNPGDKAHFPRICSNDVWNSADGRDWAQIKPNTFRDRSFDPTADWEGRHTAGYVVHREKLWIVGGDVNQGHYQSDVWSSADGAAWTLENRDRPVPWGPRALHYTLTFRDRIWVIGGQTMPAFAPSPEVFHRDIWTTTNGRDWEQVKPKEPYWSARGMIGGSVVHKDRIWILGGGTYDTPTTPARRYYNDVWSSPDGVTWERHAEHAPWTARQYHDTAAFDGRLWVLEGFTGANRNDVWYSDDGSNWYEVPATPWKPRHAASVFVHDGALWMVAGNNMKPDVWKLVRGR